MKNKIDWLKPADYLSGSVFVAVIARRDKDGKHEAKLTLNVKDLTYSVENDGQAVEL